MIMKLFRRKPAAILDTSEVEARAERLRSLWSQFHAECEEARRLGMHVRFWRDGLGDPFTGPHNFRPKLTISHTAEL